MDTYDTDKAWAELAEFGKTSMRIDYYILQDYVDQLHAEAKAEGVSLRTSTDFTRTPICPKLYVYLRRVS